MQAIRWGKYIVGEVLAIGGAFQGDEMVSGNTVSSRNNLGDVV